MLSRGCQLNLTTLPSPTLHSIISADSLIRTNYETKPIPTVRAIGQFSVMENSYQFNSTEFHDFNTSHQTTLYILKLAVQVKEISDVNRTTPTLSCHAFATESQSTVASPSRPLLTRLPPNQMTFTRTNWGREGCNKTRSHCGGHQTCS